MLVLVKPSHVYSCPPVSSTMMTTATALSCEQCVKAGNLFQDGRCKDTCVKMFYSEMCFTSEAECSQVELYQQVQAKQVCQKAKSCANCVRAHKFCGWASGHPIEWGSQPRCIVAPLWDWKFGPENVVTKTGSCPSITTPIPVCPKCGTLKKDGKLSCCAPGGAWFKNCGDGQMFQYTWADGIDACKGKCQTWAGTVCGSIDPDRRALMTTRTLDDSHGHGNCSNAKLQAVCQKNEGFSTWQMQRHMCEDVFH